MTLRYVSIVLIVALLVSTALVNAVEANAQNLGVFGESTSDYHEISDLRRDLKRRRSRSGRSKIDPIKFNIVFGFATPITDAQRQGFERARAKWMSIITKDSAAAACIKKGQIFCGYTFTANTCIDDLFIAVRIAKIDGLGKIAGSAGPCAVDDTGKSRIGVMTFDIADADNLIAMGAWDSTILHEMGHVLGLGTLWDYERLVTSRYLPPPYAYLGVNGNEGLASFAGENAGQIVVEDMGGPGTARAHWKEDVYDSELMTGYLEVKGKTMPLSAMTARALEDLGYVIDVTKADPYTMPSAEDQGRRLRTDSKKDKIPVGNDILDTPATLLQDDLIKPKKGREDEHRQNRERYAEKSKARKTAASSD
jgi:hypothetical protein